jgi:uncharacterized protein YecT (DUF1311 family)
MNIVGSGAVVASALLAAGARGADGSAACGQDQVPWRGGCFDRYQWDTDEKTCPDGVIVVPEGEDQPRCVPCKDFDGPQQPTNYCAGVLASQTDASLKAALEEVVKRLPDREAELRAGQSAWLKSRDKACRAKEKEFEGGSMAAEVYQDCIQQKNRKRTAALKAMGGSSPPAVLGCSGGPAQRTPVDRRSSVRVNKSRFYSEAKACPPKGDCPWLRKGYLVRGDEVVETAVSGEFACVTFKATTGWLPLRDLCESGTACP